VKKQHDERKKTSSGYELRGKVYMKFTVVFRRRRRRHSDAVGSDGE